jgi:hypothetical protein
MAGKTEQWVLEYLLDRDELSETVVRELYEHLSAGGEHLSKTIQVRLLLRVLREHAANITEATINALNCLAANSRDNPAGYPPFADLGKLLPSLDLYLAVRALFDAAEPASGPIFSMRDANPASDALCCLASGQDRGGSPEFARSAFGDPLADSKP